MSSRRSAIWQIIQVVSRRGIGSAAQEVACITVHDPYKRSRTAVDPILDIPPLMSEIAPTLLLGDHDSSALHSDVISPSESFPVAFTILVVAIASPFVALERLALFSILPPEAAFLSEHSSRVTRLGAVEASV